MYIPPEFRNDSNSKMTCRLKKSLYVLQQSPGAWLKKFTKAVIQYNFKQSQSDHTLFVKYTESGKVTTIIVYVDDIIITRYDLDGIKLMKDHLSMEFEIKGLRRLKYFLGIKVGRTKNEMSTS